jgi:hypothetical protein
VNVPDAIVFFSLGFAVGVLIMRVATAMDQRRRSIGD